jgi:nicotinamidase-related amidase
MRLALPSRIGSGPAGRARIGHSEHPALRVLGKGAARDALRLVVAGAQTDACIRSTLHGALVRGDDATLVSDAHTTEDQTAWGAPPPDQVIAHTNLYWTYQRAPGRTAGTVETKDVDFGGTA